MTINVEGFGKITASKEVLNDLAILFMYAEEAFERRSKDESRSEEMRAVDSRMASYQAERCHSIFEALNAVGYYKK